MDGAGDGMNVGTSVGTYKTRYILPALELVKAEDFYGNSGNVIFYNFILSTYSMLNLYQRCNTYFISFSCSLLSAQ